MRVLWLLLCLQTVLSSDFGTSYLKHTKLCQQWACINTKLGLRDALPAKNEFAPILRSLLPEFWHGAVDRVLSVCYGARPRRYTNTCPGQALLHCVMDQLIENCPDSNWKKEDACVPVTTIAGFKHMFSQSRYENLDQNIKFEHRPVWFLKNYFNVRCCELPQLFNSSVLSECGFSTFVHYNLHSPQSLPVSNPVDAVPNERHVLRIVELPDAESKTPETTTGRTDNYNDNIDPLECCDMSPFIQPSWRSECDFHLSWNPDERLKIQHVEGSAGTAVSSTEAPATTTAKTAKYNDVKVVPLSCEQETCVFRKLDIVSEAGTVDMDAFSKLLDNITDVYEEWTRAKARVVTKCLTKPITDYEANCEINKVLACTFDVLSENCPFTKKYDPCRHAKDKSDMTCQISSSKTRPKHRRQFCGIPNMVQGNILKECGINLISKMEYTVPQTTQMPLYFRMYVKNKCKALTNSTTCLAKRMGVMNKYNYLDYFKMKNALKFTDQKEFQSLSFAYTSAFLSMPLYEDHCHSPRKLLNVLDVMLMTCPVLKRKDTPSCNKIFSEMANTLPAFKNNSKEKIDQLIRQFSQVFQPPVTTIKPVLVNRPRPPIIVKTPLYKFGMLNSKVVPSVNVIPVPRKTYPKPLVLLPVYRLQVNNTIPRPYGLLRSGSLASPKMTPARRLDHANAFEMFKPM